MLFGEKIKMLRKEKGLTQAELAELCGVTHRSVQNYELKSLFPKSQEVVMKLCEALDTTPDYLISDDDRFLNKAYDENGERGRVSAEKVLENVSALFSGGQLSDRDKDAVMQAIQEAYWESKKINKKYTPKKYRRN